MFFFSSLLPFPIRVLLILGSLATAVFILNHVRKAKVQIEDSLFWLIFSGFLLFLSLFPEVISWISRWFGFISETNVVFLIIIFLLLIKLFFNSIRISQLDAKLRSLAQRMALDEQLESTASSKNKEKK